MNVYFISGVCGVGKSTLIPHLEKLLDHSKYIVKDFDARGVPDGADRLWRKRELQQWVQEANDAAALGKEMIVCGFVKSTDLEGIDTGSVTPRVIVLDADAETIKQRLINRYTQEGVFDAQQKVIGKPVTDFIADNVWYASKMREESIAAGLALVDTSHLTPVQAAQVVARLIEETA